MTANEKKNTARRATQDTKRNGPGHRNGNRPRRAINDPLGEALRSVFDTTVDEAIPAEMLDLLGKLA